MGFKIGQRVRVKEDYNWAQLATGTIVKPTYFHTDPPEVRNGLNRVVQGRQGPIVTYKVEFDEPQNDLDGDGPYRAAAIEEDYLEAIE